MIATDTIAALSSPPGRSARALIRISGPAAAALVPGLLDRVPPARGCCGARLSLGGGVDLPVLLTRADAPRSYTGQGVVEILLPGNPALVNRVLARLWEIEGVRPAGPGEFTARAYLAGKLDLAQAEGIAALIASRTERERQAAAELMSGHAGLVYRKWADELAAILALVEAGIDFTDQEDVVAISPESFLMRLGVLAKAIRERLGGASEVKVGLPRVALVGRPNAGKSTLLNALLGRRRAVESPMAGTTRDVLSEELDLSREAPGAGVVVLEDMAGLESTARGGIGTAAQARAEEAVARADALLYCDEHGFFDLPMPDGTPVIRVRTKADRVGNAHGRERIAVCALDGWNVDVLKRAIADAAWTGRSGATLAMVPRHRRALSATLSCMQQAEAEARTQGGTRFTEPEVLAGLLREAMDGIGELTGRLTADDVLGRIFATFCVGK